MALDIGWVAPIVGSSLLILSGYFGWFIIGWFFRGRWDRNE